jgi:molybdate transport system ATP-binding protein
VSIETTHDRGIFPYFSPMTPLVTFDHATIVHSSHDVALRDITWQIHEGETWAIVGSIGSGKSTLAEAIMGRHRLTAGSVEWPFLERPATLRGPIKKPSDVIRLVSFKERSPAFSYARHYYQQRFNFIEPEDDLTLDQYLRGRDSPPEDQLHEVTNWLGVSHLRALSFIKLSNGQTRRARIARALLSRPEWLILDEPFLGLDPQGRSDLLRHLDEVRQLGTRMLLISRPEYLPPWVTHVIELGRPDGVMAGPRDEWIPIATSLDEDRESREPTAEGEPVVELAGVNVRHGGKSILNGLNWTVRAGERWALGGPNGSGKSTLLSLIYGDHPQVYSNVVKLFGRARGSGETIWDVKKRIGFVSPEFHLYFSEPLSAATTAATGFFDIPAYRKTTPEQDAIVRGLFAEYGLTALADRPFTHLSTGQQRLVLFIRALVKRPELLLLDEPFQGLDTPAIVKARSWLDRNLAPDQTLIFVSHDPAEIPRCVTKRMNLEMGTPVISDR